MSVDVSAFLNTRKYVGTSKF